MQWVQKYWEKEVRERYQRYLQSDAWKTKRKSVTQAKNKELIRPQKANAMRVRRPLDNASVKKQGDST